MQVTEQSTLESVSAKVAALRDKQKGLQWTLERTVEKAEKLGDKRRGLLIRVSEGDTAAIGELEKVEYELAGIAQEGEGLQLRLDQLTTPIADAEAERAAMLQAAAAEYRARKAEQVRAEVEKQTHNVMALYRLLCRAEFTLSEYLKANVEFSQELDKLQKSEIIATVREALRVPNTWNEGWQQSSCGLGRANLTTRNACPPDDLKDLEVLR